MLKTKVCDALSKIGFKSSKIYTIIEHVSREEWKLYYDDYSIEDTIKQIVNYPDHYIDSFEDYLLSCGLKKRQAKYWSDLITCDSYTYDQKLDFIIEYTINKYVPATNKPFLYNHSLVSATEKWVDLTTDSRLCKSSKNELDDADFVYGPMVANVHQVKYDLQKAKSHNPPKYQLASKSKQSDALLKAAIHSVLWIQKT